MEMIPNRMLESEKTHHLAGNIIAIMIYTRFKQRPYIKINIADSLKLFILNTISHLISCVIATKRNKKIKENQIDQVLDN